MKYSSVLLLAVVALAGVSAAMAFPPVLDIPTTNGTAWGMIETRGPWSARAWYGIPYSKPPTGENRWKDPQPANNFTDNVLKAVNPGPGCLQSCDLPAHTCPQKISEDCLYLNIFSPVSEENGPYPVMFFVHGGHFDQGEGYGWMYNGARFANVTDTVIVTINYRLGMMGWIGNDDIGGNFGLKDQILALRWIRDNIANFAGNVDDITIFGQSAGGTSVSSLMISPATKGLFKKCIIHSNPWGLPLHTKSEAAALTSRVSTALGCGPFSDVNCMRKVTDVPTLLAAQKKAAFNLNLTDIWSLFYPWTPMIDELVPDEPILAFQKGNFHQDVQLALGSVEEEARLFVYGAFNHTKIDWVLYSGLLMAAFHEKYPPVLQMFPFDSAGDNRDILCDVVTQYLFRAPNTAAATAYEKYTGQKAYLYVFDHIPSIDVWTPTFPFCVGHCCHGTELPFMYDAQHNIYDYNLDKAEGLLSDQMNTMWANFARTGQMTSDNSWPGYDTETDMTFLLRTGQSSAEQAYQKAAIDLMMEIGWFFAPYGSAGFRGGVRFAEAQQKLSQQ